MNERVHEVLVDVARQPTARWRELLRQQFPDDEATMRQGLLWLHANCDSDDQRSSPPPLGAGDARYELGVMLDAGATATVWQAYDRTLGRNVAITVFRGARAGVVDEILVEARAVCDVISDHVVRVLDVYDDGEHRYIVMELVGEYEPLRGEFTPGRSAAVCRPTTIDEAVRWTMEVARGLHDAHLRNVFHRDVKPANVLITPLSRRARIADFGLAISAERDDQFATSGLLTHGAGGDMRIAGTPEYMAPEQARGLAVGLSARNAADRSTLVRIDVWGLGARAFELLGGVPPWGARGDLDAWEIAASGEAPPTLAKLADGARVPLRLRRIVSKAMSADPTLRYASAAELADELSAVLTKHPTSFDGGRAVRVRLWSQRNPQFAITASVALLLAAAVLGAYLSIVRLHHRQAELALEMAGAEVQNQHLADRNKATRAELAQTESNLASQNAALASLQRALDDGKREYQGIIEAKEQALRDADAATRKLVEELAATRGDRDVAEYGRVLYEGYWTTAKNDIARLTLERDHVVAEREQIRVERDNAAKERDASREALGHAVADRDTARAATDEVIADRARLQAELAQVNRLVATLHAQLDAPHSAAVPTK